MFTIDLHHSCAFMLYTSIALQLLVHFAMLLCIFYSSSLPCILHLTVHLLPSISTFRDASPLRCIFTVHYQWCALLHQSSTAVHCHSASLLMHIFLHLHCASPVVCIDVHLYSASFSNMHLLLQWGTSSQCITGAVHLYCASSSSGGVCIISRVDGM